MELELFQLYAGKKDEAKKQFVPAEGLDLTPADKAELARQLPHGRMSTSGAKRTLAGRPVGPGPATAGMTATDPKRTLNCLCGPWASVLGE